MKRNTHEGSSFDDFLKEEGIYEDVEAAAVKKVIATMLAKGGGFGVPAGCNWSELARDNHSR